MTQTGLTADNTRRIIETADWNVEINEAGQGYPVFLLHGTGPGATGWTNFAPNLIPLAEKFRVIALTFPGWGRSSENVPGKEPQRKSNARAIKLVMDALNIEKAALVGNSMGGVAVEQFVADYPDRISHFVTMGSMSPGVSMFSPGGVTEGIRIIAETYREPTPENFRRLVRIMVYDDSFVTDELCELRSRAALANEKHLANWLSPKRDASPGGDEVVAALARATIPALIFHGRDDRTVVLENSMRLNAMLTNSRLVVFNRCGHWAQVEHAKEFNALLEGFITRNL
jgi:2-hydroxy-6-oxonona-2,4-dienedioate hydrolase